MRKIIAPSLVFALLCLSLNACSQQEKKEAKVSATEAAQLTKDTGKKIGTTARETARETTRTVGHTTRDVTKKTGHFFRDIFSGDPSTNAENKADETNSQ